MCDGVYQIRVPIVKLDTISKDMLDRLFTKRVEKKLDYTDVTKDLDQFIEMSRKCCALPSFNSW